MDESHLYYVVPKKPDTKEYLLHVYEVQEQTKLFEMIEDKIVTTSGGNWENWEGAEGNFLRRWRCPTP